MKSRAFTFIEMLVVIGIISIALPTLYAIFFLILQQQVRLVRLSEVNRQGNFVINMIEDVIGKNALSIHTSTPSENNRVCAITVPAVQTTYTGALYFKDRMGNSFYFDLTGSPGKISSESSIPNTSAKITSSKVITSNFSSNCSVSGFSRPLTNFSFDLCYNIGNSCGSAADKVSLRFDTTVSLPPY